jgi:hypothetical protein
VGGYGSGRWFRHDTKAKTNTLFRIDINDLRRSSGLKPGARGQVWQSVRGVLGGFVLFEIKKDRVLLEYEYQAPEMETQLVIETIWLTHTPCNYGGKRAWFSCPQCCKRVAVLFRVDRRFRCRKCHKLSYQTQCWDQLDRSGHLARKIRVQLGGSGGLGDAFPPKPVGMHLKTYFTLMQRALKAEWKFWTLMEEKIDQL